MPNELKWLDLLLPAGLGIASAFYPSAARGAQVGINALGLFSDIEKERYRRKLMKKASDEMRANIDKMRPGLEVGRKAYIGHELQRQQEQRQAQRDRELAQKEEIRPLSPGGPEMPLVKPDAATTRESGLRFADIVQMGETEGLPSLSTASQPSMFEAAVSDVQPTTFAEQMLAPYQERALEAAPEDIIAREVPPGPRTFLEAITPIDTPYDSQLRAMDLQRANALVDPSSAAYMLGTSEYQERAREIELERIAKQQMENAKTQDEKYRWEWALKQLQSRNKMQQQQAKVMLDLWAKKNIPIPVAHGVMMPGDQGFEFVRTHMSTNQGKLDPKDPKSLVSQIFILNKQIENLKAKQEDNIPLAQASTAAIQSMLQLVYSQDEYEPFREMLRGLALAYGVDIDPATNAARMMMSDEHFGLIYESLFGSPPPTGFALPGGGTGLFPGQEG